MADIPPQPSEQPQPPPPSGSWSTPPTAPPPSFNSNYPRAQMGGFGYFRPPGVYFDTITTAFEMVKANWGVYVVSVLLMFAITFGVSLAMNALFFSSMASSGWPFSNAAMPVWFVFPQFLGQVVQAFVLLCLVGVGVRNAQTNVVTINDFFLPFRKFGPAVVAAAINASPLLVFDAGQLLMQSQMKDSNPFALIPFLIFCLVFVILYMLLYAYLIVGGTAAIFTDLSPLEAFAETFRRMKWQAPLLSLLVFLAGLVAGLGVLACGVGLLFTYSIVTNVLALHFTYYFPPTQPGMVSEATGQATYGM